MVKRRLAKKKPMPTPNYDAAIAFFGWIEARHAAWYSRTIMQEAPPWCDDEIVNNNFFTNVYRELDPGTAYFQDRLVGAGSTRQAVFWALAYRLAFHERSMEALLEEELLDVDAMQDNSPAIRALLRSIDKPFTSAYVVSNYGKKGSKIDVITDVLMGIAETIQKEWDEDWRHEGMLKRSEFVQWCRDRIYGVGDFVSFQALVDLSYRHVNPPWLPTDNDGWVVAGPGALKGLSILFPNHTVNARSSNRLIHALSHKATIALRHRMNGWGEGAPMVPIDASNMQNCCCEFSKYMRILEGGSGKRGFRADQSHEADKLSRGHGAQMEITG